MIASESKYKTIHAEEIKILNTKPIPKIKYYLIKGVYLKVSLFLIS